MVLYFKKILFPKEINAGYTINGNQLKTIIKIEKTSDTIKLTFNSNNLLFDKLKDYYLFVSDSINNIYYYNINTCIKDIILNKNFILNDSLSVCLLNIQENNFFPVCYAFLGKRNTSIEEFINYAKKTNTNIFKEEAESSKNGKCEELATEKYNDEVVATENYFEIEEKINERKNQSSQNVEIKTNDTEEKNQNCNKFDFNKDETDNSLFNSTNFYSKISQNLENLLSSYPNDKNLSKLIPNSCFVKIMYDETKYYIVGKITENNSLKYICYGIPGYYQKIPPELGEYCSFIPSDVFNLEAQGFWLIFQDPHTGKNIKPQLNC